LIIATFPIVYRGIYSASTQEQVVSDGQPYATSATTMHADSSQLLNITLDSLVGPVPSASIGGPFREVACEGYILR
jgi:hypothetical protein